MAELNVPERRNSNNLNIIIPSSGDWILIKKQTTILQKWLSLFPTAKEGLFVQIVYLIKKIKQIKSW